jgi:poly(3-hydroxybutyrate) depolymerase
MQVTDSPTAWKTHDIMVNAVAAAYKPTYVTRRYWTRPPPNYDPSKAYPLTLWGQGCGQGGNPENTPMTLGPAAAASIQVELLAPQVNNHCYYAGPDGDKADSPELPYFDQVVSEVEAAFCIDKNKVYQGGYSSGGWFSALMSCNRTNVVKGVGWAAAGLQNNHDPCVGPVPALITRGMADPGTPLDRTMAALDDIRMRNGCATTTKPWKPVWAAGEQMADTSSCVLYDNCMPGYPLVWCPTPGGHTNTEGDTHLTRYALWKLWTTLQ